MHRRRAEGQKKKQCPGVDGAQWRSTVRGASVLDAFIPNATTAGAIRERCARRARRQRRLRDLDTCHACDVADGG
jgi:hypothetical protein